MDFRVLGPVAGFSDGEPIRLGGPKQRTVLALLLREPGRVVSSDVLIDGVWGDDATTASRSTLQSYIFNLRSELGDVLVTEAGGYRLAVDRERVDASRFENAVAEGTSLLDQDPLEAAQILRESLAMWEGHPFTGAAPSLRLEAEARRLEELRVRALEGRIDAELDLGRHAELLAELEVLTAEFPLSERFRTQQMLALYRAGRQSEALRCYQKARRYLAEELGLDPSPELRRLERQILEHDPELQLTSEPRVQTIAVLMTDIDDAARLWEERAELMPRLLQRHDEIIEAAIDECGGRVFRRTGDGMAAAFEEVTDAVSAAERSQRALADEPELHRHHGDGMDLRVRIAVDAGDVESRDGDFSGPPVPRCGRLLAAAHGGQILLSEDAHTALSGSPTAGWQVRAHGEHSIKGLSRPQHVFQLVLDGLDGDFPPLRVDDTPPSLPGGGRAMRGFELRNRIGAGMFGVVYRAYQPSVGRLVAVKVIRPELVNDPEFIRRFETDAHVVATLEHPHIVPLYDYWRDPDGACLVTRWFRGGSLRAVLERDPPSVERAMRLLQQIGGALGHAHRQGIVHRDFKAANVLLDEEGNGYLADFGIAAPAAATIDARVPAGSSPTRLPPEMLRGIPATVRTDIYAFGVVMFELLAGRPAPVGGTLPSVADLRPELPAAVDEVVARATSDVPADRYPSIEQLLTAITNAVGQPAGGLVATEPTAVRNPYKGLHAFQEADSDDFHGRSGVVDELIAAVAAHRLVAVVGPSGIGKSSVVRAGLVPHLRAGGTNGAGLALPSLVTDMLPGAFPFEELARALLRIAVRCPDTLVDDLANDDHGLVDTARRILPPGDRVLLVIDQFEELFTLTADDTTRRRFIDNLAALARDDHAPLSVLLTLRADFLDRPLSYPELGELLTAGTVMVAAPGRDELLDAIRLPAENVGVGFEPGLVERIASEVADQPGGLPLLQYALTELFDRRTSNTMTTADYEGAGGVMGALGTRADELFAGFEPVAQDAVRQIFLRLVTVDEATRTTRRRVARRELRALPLDPTDVDEVLDRFGCHRLLTFDRHPVIRAPTVEIAHEALLGEWDRLRGWIDERREDLLLHHRLAEAVDDWQQADREPSYLLSGGRLAHFETLAATTDLALSSHETAYLHASRQAADRRDTRQRRRRRVLVSALAVGLAITTVLATLALLNQQRADRNRQQADRDADVARARELAAAAVAVVDDDPALSKLLAVTSASFGDLTTESISALHQAWAADPVAHRHAGPPRDLNGIHASIDPSGTRGVVAGWGDLGASWNYLEVFDVGTGRVLWAFEPEHNSANPTRPSFAPDGNHVVTGVVWVWLPWEDPDPPTESVGAFLLDAETGEVTERIDLGRCGGLVDGVSERYLLVKTLRGPAEETCDWFTPTTVELVDLSTGDQRVLTDDGSDWASGAALSADGRYVAFDDFGTGVANVIEVATGETVLSFESQDRLVRAISPDGSLLAYGDDPIDVWDVSAGEVVASYSGHQGDSFFATFDPSGDAVYSTGEDGDLHHWTAATGDAITIHPRIGSLNASVSDGGVVVVAHADDTIAVVDTTARGEVGAIETCPGSVMRDSLDVSDGLMAFAIRCEGDLAGTTHVVDVESLDVRYTVHGHGPMALSVSPDGTRFARQEADGTMVGTITIRDIATGETLVELNGLCDFDDASHQPLDEKDGCRPYPEVPFALWAEWLRWSPDGTMIASGSRGGAIVWDASTGELLFTEEPGPGGFWLRADEGNYAFDVIFTPDSSRLIAAGDADLRVFATDTWQPHQQVVNNDIGYAFGFLEFSPDGSTLLGIEPANGDPGARLTWLDADTLEWLDTITPTHQAGISSRALSPNGDLVATGGADGLVRLWDVGARVLVHEIPFGAVRIAGLAFVNDRHLAVLPDGGNVVVVTTDRDELVEIVRGSLSRGFTDAECERFNLGADCPTLAELRGALPGDDPSVLNGTYELDWTFDELVTALIDANPDENLDEEFAATVWEGGYGLQRAGNHTLRFHDGRWDHSIVTDDATWRCTGTYTVVGDRVDLVPERGVCVLQRLFDATFVVADGELRFTDYNGRPLDRVIHAVKPWQQLD